MIYFYDFETTGTNPNKDLPIQVACLADDGTEITNCLANPGISIDAGATMVHGISNTMVMDQVSSSYAVWDMLRRIQEHAASLEEPVILAGYNIQRYDMLILNRCFAPWFTYSVLDVMRMVYRYEPHLPSKKLSDVHLALTKTPLEGAHGAIADCVGTRAVWHALSAKHSLTVNASVEELKVPKVYNTMPVGKYRGLPLEKVPISWAEWMKNNATDLDPDMEATISHFFG